MKRIIYLVISFVLIYLFFTVASHFSHQSNGYNPNPSVNCGAPPGCGPAPGPPPDDNNDPADHPASLG